MPSDKGLGAESDGEGAIVTAFKPPEKGNGWVVRLANPHDEPVEVYLTPHDHPERVYKVTMAEEPEGLIEADANGRVLVSIGARKILTLRIMFG